MLKFIPAFLFLFFIQFTHAQSYFEEITQTAGIAYTGNKNQGIAFADFDNDGDQDIYAFTRLNDNQLFENQGDGTFVNIAPNAYVNHFSSTKAAVWGDINNDGWLDLYIANYQSKDILYLNLGPDEFGQVTFDDITIEAGILNENEPISVHMADLDNDGWLDIYVANFMGENRYYRNNQDLTFSDQIHLAGLSDNSFSMGCSFFDYDNDGDLDVYLVHDFQVPNILYQNDGTGHFMNVAHTAAVDIARHGMGVDVADINHDGWMDIYITDLDENVLFLNNADGTFTDIGNSAGVDDTGMGWSTMFLDFDNDGWVDIYVVNDSQFSPESNVLFKNNGDLTFEKTAIDEAICSEFSGVGGACADINNDGFLDIAISNTFTGDGNQMFKNMGNDKHWIAFDLIGSSSNFSAVGTRIIIEYGNGEKQIDELLAGSGFAGQNGYPMHFGLGENTKIEKLTIRWPNGSVDEYADLNGDQIHAFTQTDTPLMDPEIISVIQLVDNVEQYGKLEAEVELTASFSNPYDYDEIWVKADLNGPDGQQITVDGFYMQDYELNSSTGGLTPVGNGAFRIRFAPDAIGEWTYTVSVTDSTGSVVSDEMNFQCVDIVLPANKGFIRTNQSNYLGFDNGEQYIAIGENIAWQNSNAYNDYKNWLGQLIANGGNFFRLWHAHWGLGIEWKDGWSAFEGLRRYKQSNCFYQDWLFDFCAANDVYVMLALQHHGPVSTNVNPNWVDSPYNIENDGPCANTWDFFTNDEALAHTKNRYRYIMARWGYSRSIMSWELFNEVEWTDNYSTHKQKVRDWHYEMAEFLKTNDPYKHIVTTSYAHENEDPEVWSHPDFDITQTHHYFNTPHLERTLANANRSYLEEFEKPTLNGEFGLGGSAALANDDPDGIHIHNNLWGPLFSGGFGTGMTWWWDNYIHPKDLYYHFDGISQFSDNVPFMTKHLSPAVSYTSGTSGDLILTPSLGWGSVANGDFSIDQNGNIYPQGAALSTYLYGSAWNTQFRSPPNFSVFYPEEGAFTVRTSSSTGTAPKIAIYVNGNEVLEESGSTDTEYTITVPAGNNLIKVDNTGTDWISISSYSFGGIGTLIDAYTLSSDDNELAAGWVLNNEYNHENVNGGNTPEPAIGGQLTIEEFADGDYYVKWYDCLTGALFDIEQVSATGGNLNFNIPELYWDAAFLVDDQSAVVLTNEQRKHLPFNIYPNPIKKGNTVNISFDIEVPGDSSISLLDRSGKLIKQLKNQSNTFTLPNQVPAGFYWIKVVNDSYIGTKPLVIVD